LGILWTGENVQCIDRKMNKWQCQALGLNICFPRAVLHESATLKGLKINLHKCLKCLQQQQE
jgi:hypothetical protein